jgi:hypothetical protein
MKATCFLFLMIVCAALTPETGYAAQSDSASQQAPSQSPANAISDHPPGGEHVAAADDSKNLKDKKPSERQRKSPDKDDPFNRASLTTSNRRNQTLNSRERSTSGMPMNLHRLGSDKSGASARGGSIHHETFNRAVPVRPASIRPRVPLPDNVRHRGANPAVIDGSAISNNRNAGAIDGAHMNRRP